MNEQVKQSVQWLVKGDHDLGTAKITFLHIPEFSDTVGFHCQQAFEKYLKAYLIALSVSFKYTHDLVYLLELVISQDMEFKKYYELCLELQGYAVEIRYPDGINFPSTELIEQSIKGAKECRNSVCSRLGIKVEYNPIMDS